MRYVPLHMPIPRRLALALASVGLAAVAAPAVAQTTVDEFTVVGRISPDGRPETLSRAVYIADIDLRSGAGVREMQRRIRYTARDLCNELGENSGPGLTASCIDEAVRGAQRQARFAIAQARAPDNYAYYAAPPAPYAEDYAPPAAAVVPDPYPR